MSRFPLFIIPLVGCASNPRPVTEVARTETTAAPMVASKQAFSLTRTGVKKAIARGLGAFLGEIRFEDQPVMQNGKFFGFRVQSLSSAPEWKEVDVRPGDVVMSINGLPIGMDQEADFAFRSLSVASELWVMIQRDGKPRELRIPIAD